MVRKFLFFALFALAFSQPEPAPAPTPEPTPEPTPAPTPEPSPTPSPEPAPAAPAPVAPEPAPAAPAPVPEPAPVGPEPAPVGPEPAPVGPEPAPSPVGPEPVPVGPEPVPVGPEPAPVGPEPAPSPVGPEPAPVAPSPVGPEPAPVAPSPVGPEPSPSPAPAPPPPPIDNYLFDRLGNTSAGAPGPEPRTGAIIGSNYDQTLFYVLGGTANDGSAPHTAYTFDLAARKYSQLEGFNFSRTGACYAQDVNNRNSIWVFGGVPDHIHPYEFLTFSLADHSIHGLASPAHESISTDQASCVVDDDGTNFYALFGNLNGTCSNHIAVYTAASNWTVLAATNPPPGRFGANALFYKGTIVVFGGYCENYFNDVYHYDIATKNWTKHDSFGQAPSPRSHSSAFIQGDFLYVIGGETSTGGTKDTYSYNLLNHTWTLLANLTGSLPDARSAAATVSLVNRAVLFGGNNGGVVFGDTWQFVLEFPCLGLKCEDCTRNEDLGCGWCPDGQCVAGDATAAFVPKTCTAAGYTNDLNQCPESFPSYAIALIVIGGVVLVGIIIFAIMKWRSGKSDYQEIS